MTKLKKNIIRYKLIEEHRKLTKGSYEDMQIAKRILHFLNVGEIRIGIGDQDMIIENLFENVGITWRYTGRYYSAYARINWRCA